MNKSFATFLLSVLVFACSQIAYTQNYPTSYPLFLWGPGLNGSSHQTTAIYSDVTNGLLVEAPKNASDNKLDISFNWRGGGTVPFIIKGNSGYVGIGTPSPAQMLEVAGVIQSSIAGIKIGPSNTALASDGFSLYLKAGGNTYLNTNSNAYVSNSGGASFADNVGIGTSSPQLKFEVVGNGQVIRNVNPAGYTTLRLYNNENNPLRALEIDYASSNYPGSLLSGGPTGESASIGSTGAYPLVLGTNNAARVTIGSNGNVGIGTTSPNQKLTVKGTVYSTEVKVDVSAGTGPDYVFEPSYNLPTLADTEAYIKANKRLPEVPSAKEMEANGINLSEMNMLLLKKVEELTLHLIEANKRIEKLEEKQK